MLLDLAARRLVAGADHSGDLRLFGTAIGRYDRLDLYWAKIRVPV